MFSKTTPRSKESKRITRSFVTLVVLCFAVCIVAVYAGITNKHRIQDIQDSRLSSCVLTYTGMQKVLLPIFTDPPQTPRRIRHTMQFKTAVRKLKNQCYAQTKPR